MQINIEFWFSVVIDRPIKRQIIPTIKTFGFVNKYKTQVQFFIVLRVYPPVDNIC